MRPKAQHGTRSYACRLSCMAAFVLAAFFALRAGQSAAFAAQADADAANIADAAKIAEAAGIRIEPVSISVPGLKKTYRLLWCSDLHIGMYPDDPDVDEEHASAVAERCAMYRNADGRSPDEVWKDMSACIDRFGADVLILGADMLDYASAANLDALRSGLSGVETPWMYIRADHDYARWYGPLSLKKMRKLHRALAPQDPVWVSDLGEILVIGLDNTTSALSEEALERVEELFSEGKPVILCMHVPVDQEEGGLSGSGESLADLSRRLWEGRVLCWGDGDEYDTGKSAVMKKLLDLIRADDSPVAAVLTGHLHTAWDGLITLDCTEHVFEPAFTGSLGMITVSP